MLDFIQQPLTEPEMPGSALQACAQRWNGPAPPWLGLHYHFLIEHLIRYMIKKALIFSQHLKKGNDFTVLVEMQNGPATLENSWTISLKSKQTLPLQFSNCTIKSLALEK